MMGGNYFTSRTGPFFRAMASPLAADSPPGWFAEVMRGRAVISRHVPGLRAFPGRVLCGFFKVHTQAVFPSFAWVSAGNPYSLTTPRAPLRVCARLRPFAFAIRGDKIHPTTSAVFRSLGGVSVRALWVRQQTHSPLSWGTPTARTLPPHLGFSPWVRRILAPPCRAPSRMGEGRLWLI